MKRIPLSRVQHLREEIEAGEPRDRRRRSSKYDLDKAAELQYGKLPQLQKQLEAGRRRR